MAYKGKGKAKAISGPVIVSSDEENDSRFFESQKPVRVNNLPSTARMPSPEYSESESSGGTVVRRKKKKKAALKPSLPEWTRKGLTRRSESRRGKERDTSGDTDDVINLISSDEDEAGGGVSVKKTKNKGKGKAREKDSRRQIDRLSLTPPPVLSNAKLQQIAEVVRNYHTAINLQNSTPGDDRGPSSQSRSEVPSQQSITIVVRMHADPARVENGASANAIRNYEKLRSVVVKRDEPLTGLYSIIADQIGKEPEDLIMTRNGVKIFSTVVTSRQLHLEDRVQFEGYERHVWEEMDRARASSPTSPNGRQPQSQDQTLNQTNPLTQTNGDPDPDNAAKTRIRIKLRGAWGECKLGVSAETTSRGLLEYYKKKYARRDDGIYLVFDGEKVKGDVSVADIGIEDQDVVDVGGC